MVRFSAACVTFLLLCRPYAAQVTTVRLEGLVKDASGNVLPRAAVSVVNDRTRARTETSSGPEGLFTFPSLQPGLYSLTVEAQGFRKTVVTSLELNVGETVAQTVMLEVGEVVENVTVVAEAVRVQRSDAQIGRAVTLRDIEVLPQLGRMPIALALTSPGMQNRPGSVLMVTSVNGARQGSTNTKLDGIDVNDSATPFLALSVAAYNTDSIEEFRITTSGGKAEYGRSAGAQIEMITRSGSNEWHGNVFEYHRNTAFNANTFFNNSSGSRRPVFIQNVFGGSLGGPFRRDRTFIFVNFQGRRTAEQQVFNRRVLTAEAKSGVFRWRSPLSGELCKYSIPVNPKVDEILDWLPKPNNDAIGDKLNTAGFRFNGRASPTRGDGYNDELTVRADHSLWNGHRVFLRWSWQHPWIFDWGNEQRYPDQPGATQRARNAAYSIGSTWAITSRLVNELRVGHWNYTLDVSRPARLPSPMLLANSWTDPLNPAFSYGRVFSLHQVTESVTFAQGRHTWKGGLDWRFTRESTWDDNGIWPNVSFKLAYGNVPSVGPTGDTVISPEDRQTFEKLYNDLTGRMDQVVQTFYSDLEKFQPAGTPRERTHQYREYGYFFQDDWRLHPRVVLNLGLRYEYSAPPREINGLQGTVDKAALLNSSAHLTNLTMLRSSRWYGADFNNFAPRVGFAWDLAGNGKTALRANWGIFYERRIGAATYYVDMNTPGFAQKQSFFPNKEPDADARVSDNIPVPAPPSAPQLCPPTTRSTDLFLFDPKLRTGYVQHYSLTVQREVSRNTVLEAGYVGTRGTKLFMFRNLNQPRIYDGFLDSFRELQAYRAHRTPVPASNTLVRIFGSADYAVAGIGGSILEDGAVGSAADTLDRARYSLYAPAGVLDSYLRNFPQFNRVVMGTNDGRSYYDSFQLSLRRQTGALKFVANYTFSKSIDITSAEGIGYDRLGITGSNPPPPVDNFNLKLSRGRSDLDTPHAFNTALTYTLPVGKGRRFVDRASRWVDAAVGGWDLGTLVTWQSGLTVTYLSGFATGPTTESSYVNYTGDRNIGRVMRKGDGVYWLTQDEISRFSYPAAGEIGTGGRNAFRGPRFFDVDLSLVKRFAIKERHSVLFRAEAYNVFNNANFARPNSNLSDLTFGKISENMGSPRVLQLALRYNF